MKELWTGINNIENKDGTIHTEYTVRFKTNSRYDYRLVEDFCRKVLDGNYIEEKGKQEGYVCPKCKNIFFFKETSYGLICGDCGALIYGKKN